MPSVKGLMTCKVGTVGPDEPLVAAARRMRDDDVGCLMVVDGGRLIGVLTDRDIVVRAFAEGAGGHRARVRDAMSVRLVVCREDQAAEEAGRIMAQHGVRRLPVLGRHGRLVGVLSRSDLAAQPVPERRPRRVTFYKQLTTSCGQPRSVSLRTVYISESRSREDAAAAAIERFEAEHAGRPWSRLADRFEVAEPR